MLESVCVYAIVTSVHHVVVCLGIAKCRIRTSHNLECFIAAGCGHDGVCGSDCRDDVLDDALSKGVGDAWNIEFLGTVGSALVEPGDVFGIVGVKSVI